MCESLRERERERERECGGGDIESAKGELRAKGKVRDRVLQIEFQR